MILPTIMLIPIHKMCYKYCKKCKFLQLYKFLFIFNNALKFHDIHKYTYKMKPRLNDMTSAMPLLVIN